jgi:hypothetical protein
VEYSPEVHARAAVELLLLPDGTVIVGWMVDYAVLALIHVEQPWRRARMPDDLTICWTRRSCALVTDAWEQVEVPLAEDFESYDAQILDGTLVKRTLTSSTTSILYTSAQQAADWGASLVPGSTLAIRIHQLSNRLCHGDPATAILQF